MNSWLSQHRDAARQAFSRLLAAPLDSALSILTIAIALALPAGMHMLTVNAQKMIGVAHAAPQISIFMQVAGDRRAALEIDARLRRFGGIASVQFLPREETLARMKTHPGLRDAIDALPANPFSDAFIVTAADERAAALEKLAGEFRQWPKVDHVQLDSAWIERLEALFKLARTANLLLAGLLGIGLIAITFNTIRMQVLAGRNEIEVCQLLGATDRFIQRPFLHYGVVLGLAGGVVAWFLVGICALQLRSPLGELAHLYDLTLILQPLDAQDSILLLVFAGSLGWLGARLSLHRFLRRA